MKDSGKRVWKGRALDGPLRKKKGYGAVENYLDNCVHMKMDVEVLERLMEPENQEVSPRFILQYSTREGGKCFPAF